MKLTETQKTRIEKEDSKVIVSPEYFMEGEYTHWQDNTEETKNMSYTDFQAWLVDDMRKYDSIVVYSDGCIYGIVGGISHDISYDDFTDKQTYIELIEKYGIDGTLEYI
jgi:hypothetical protein